MSKGKSIFKQLKDLLFGKTGHELLVFCFFLIVSFGFWLLQALNETLEKEVQVTLKLENIPEDIVLIDSLPPSISVTLQDRGLTLARYNISNLFRHKSIKLNFMEFATEQEDAEVYISNGDVQRMLRRIFPASTRILSIRPDTLRFAYNHGRFQTIPVKLSGTLNASSQHYIQTAVVEPDSVRVYAPKAVLDTMQAVYTDAFVLDEVNNSGTYQIALRKQKFIKHEPEQVKLKVSVGYYTEKAFQIPIIGLNFPAGKKFRAFPEKVTIKFRVESGRYNNIKPENFVLSTTYEELLQENSSGKLMLSLKNVPEGVSNVSISPQEVDYLIEQVEEQDNNQ